MTSGKDSRPCPECGVKASSNASNKHHCKTDDCSVAYFKTDFFGTVTKIVYCADREEERV